MRISRFLMFLKMGVLRSNTGDANTGGSETTEEYDREWGNGGCGGVERKFDDGIYTIDAAKRRKYDDLFPVEAKKFGYDPKAKAKSVEDALDDRVKKKADRYCK